MRTLSWASKRRLAPHGRGAIAVDMLGLWQWLMLVVALFGLVIPALLVTWMVWLRRPRQPAPTTRRAHDDAERAAVAVRDGR